VVTSCGFASSALQPVALCRVCRSKDSMSSRR
jgi:hypothetical protein